MDIKDLSTAQLRAIYDIAVNGVAAQASADKLLQDQAEIQRLQTECLRLSRVEKRRNILFTIGETYDTDPDYWDSFSEEDFATTVKIFKQIISHARLQEHFNRASDIWGGK